MAGLFTKLDAQVFRNNHRNKKRERTHKTLENNDFLLTQIDEFREKAKQLQELLLSKESKVKELQTIVAERETRLRNFSIFWKNVRRKRMGLLQK